MSASSKKPAIQRTLTDAQKKEAVTLFKRGHERYTDLTAELSKTFKKDIPYQAVNTFMTKWKRKEGIIQKRAERSDKKNKSAPAPQNLNNNTSAQLPEILMEELRALRSFYERVTKGTGSNGLTA